MNTTSSSSLFEVVFPQNVERETIPIIIFIIMIILFFLIIFITISIKKCLHYWREFHPKIHPIVELPSLENC